MATSAQLKGQQLEQVIGSFLAANGQVRLNVILEGRSGACHDLDVVGDKSDLLTTFRLVVECKAWAAPVEKDVVYKLAAVLADLAAAKGVVVCLGGWTPSAEAAAWQAGIELWGPDEIAGRLARPALSDVQVGSAMMTAPRFDFAVGEEPATAAAVAVGRGVLSRRRKCRGSGRCGVSRWR